ncbi:flippase-like domain-containing protein [Natronomonas gomsonensis]|nr:flippase-like domain-containing protein [Natronomonas gomsonensis]
MAWPMDRGTTLKLLVGFAVALVLVYLLGAVIGWDRTIERLRTADLYWVGVACVSTLLCLLAWTKTWQVVLGAAGVNVPFRKLVVTFYAATFANYITPMGQAGGEPFIAYILSRDTEANYEQSLASVVTADLLRMLPFFNVGLVGLGYLLLQSQLPEGTEQFAALLLGLAITLPVGIVLAWRYRDAVQRAVVRLFAPLATRTDRFTVEGVRKRIDRLYESIDLIAESPWDLLVAVAFAYVGWVLFALPLYFSGLALGLEISLLLVAFLVPVTVIAGSTPLPGGLAAIEGSLVVLLTALLAFTADEALAVTTVYRLTSYWFVVGVGGIATFWVLARV